MHARNTLREVVASDDLTQSAEMIANITHTLEASVNIAETTHATFAAFGELLRNG
jgi:hypothetical protein